ncbi:MAG: leucine-rich repeat domain-containing protein, partial [Ruminococcus sp.]|nr:leucine-rich repeat domain-containing protein [Ruminococcus sp.]
MPIKRATCPSCAGAVLVDDSKRAGICKYCGEPFVIEDAVNIYNTTNNNTIKTDVVNIYSSEQSDFVIRGGVLEKYNGADTVVVIPDGVTHIGDEAFAGCQGITSITMPDSVVEILNSLNSKGAFCGCKNLTSVYLSNRLESIGNKAFQYCHKLNNIVIPESVQYIGFACFSFCDS